MGCISWTHLHIAIRSETINGSGRGTLRIDTTVYRSSVERVDTGGGGGSFELVGIYGGMNGFNLIKVEHGSITIPDSFLRNRISAAIRSRKTIWRKVHTLEAIACNGATRYFNDRG